MITDDDYRGIEAALIRGTPTKSQAQRDAFVWRAGFDRIFAAVRAGGGVGYTDAQIRAFIDAYEGREVSWTPPK